MVQGIILHNRILTDTHLDYCPLSGVYSGVAMWLSRLFETLGVGVVANPTQRLSACVGSRVNAWVCVPEARYPINPTLSVSSVWGCTRLREHACRRHATTIAWYEINRVPSARWVLVWERLHVSKERPERAVISQPRATPWVDVASADYALKGQKNPCRCCYFALTGRFNSHRCTQGDALG